MNLVYYLLTHFFEEEKWNTILMVMLSLTMNVFQTNGISYLTATIIESIRKGKDGQVLDYFKYFVAISTFLLVLDYGYQYYNNKLSTKLRQWIRHKLIKMILDVNNDNFSETNFTYMTNPINRISSVSYLAFKDIITYILPNIMFLIMITVYFTYKNPGLGGIFVAGNIALILYFLANWESIADQNEDYEEKVHEADNYMIEILNNVDKIIYRGQTVNEIDIFDGKITNNINSAFDFYSLTSFHGTVMNAIAFTVMFSSIGFLIHLYFKKQIDITTFITFFTIILLYRDKTLTMIQQVPDFVEFKGRAESVAKYFKNMHEDYDSVHRKDGSYVDVDLPFRQIRFDDVSFKYKSELPRGQDENTADGVVKNKQIFNHMSITLDTYNKIIGITGLSGNGKSTFVKLILKLYQPDSGAIYIDNQNIENLDPNYIRQHMTYVNQNSKLFDRKVYENMMYGCSDEDACSQHLEEIMAYSKIRELYRKMDIYKKRSGALGENLSGGQRQVVNIIGGLINPSKILVLDEPTNALDPDLKTELIKIINHFRKYKQAILIITHDRDMYPLFDETIQI
jgi:ATP-binding cassette subfamily B protein